MSIKKGGVISFRLPHDTSNDILIFLNKLKNTTGRTFSSRISQIFLNGLADELRHTKNDYIFLNIPKEFPAEKKKWLQSKETQQYILSTLMEPLIINQDTNIVSETVFMGQSNNKIPNETETFINDNFFDFDD